MASVHCVLLINLIHVFSYGLQGTTYMMNNMYTCISCENDCVVDCDRAKVRLVT